MKGIKSKVSLSTCSLFFQRNPLERTQFFYGDFYLEIHFFPIGGHLKHLALLLNVTNHPGFFYVACNAKLLHTFWFSFFLIENDMKKNPDDNVHRLYNWSPEFSNGQNFRFSYYKLPYEMYFRFCVISTCILVCTCIFQSNWNLNLEQTIKQSPDIPWTFFEKKNSWKM